MLTDSGGALPEREIVFFGGKGGVGKTTLACAYALRAAERECRTLLVSTDPAHSTSDMLEQALGGDPCEVVPNLWAMEIDPALEVDRYIGEVKQRILDATAPRLLPEVERQIDAARVSPGAEESAVFDRFTRILEDARGQYDRVVFDTAPTGHAIRLLSLPELMSTWISGLISRRRKVSALGRMWRNVAGAAAGDEGETRDPLLDALLRRKARFERARTVLTDATRTAFVFVVTPERLAVLETSKAVQTLEKYRVPIGAIVVNRVLPDEAAGVFVDQRRTREATHRQSIAQMFARYPMVHVPLLSQDVIGIQALRELRMYAAP